MKKILFAMIMIPFIWSSGQKLGEIAEKKKPQEFPHHAWGVDIMFGEGGFGLGGFMRRDLTEDITGFVDLSFTESKDEREVEYIDYFGRKFVIGKKNRVFLIPFNIGIHYRLFGDILTENLRPYLNAGVGPTFVITTPYDKEFFSSFGKAKLYPSAGGYVGFGANFGLSKSNLIGINVRYYWAHLFNGGVESLKGRLQKDLKGLFITLNIGMMY